MFSLNLYSVGIIDTDTHDVISGSFGDFFLFLTSANSTSRYNTDLTFLANTPGTVNSWQCVPLCEVWRHAPFQLTSFCTLAASLAMFGVSHYNHVISLELCSSVKSQTPVSSLALIVNVPCHRVVLGRGTGRMWWVTWEVEPIGRASIMGTQSFPLLLALWSLHRRFAPLTDSYRDVCRRVRVTSQSTWTKSLNLHWTFPLYN